MTRTTAVLEKPAAPPAGYPALSWDAAPADFYVPEHLRDFYAAADAYSRGGLTLVETLPHELAIARAQAAGRLVGSEPTNPDELRVQPDDVVNTRERDGETRYSVVATRHLTGPAGFPVWQHLTRLELARQQRERQVASTRARAQRECAVCHDGSADRPLGIPDLPAVNVCAACSAETRARAQQLRKINGKTRAQLVDVFLAGAGWEVTP